MILAAVVPPQIDSAAFWSRMGWVDVVLAVVFLIGAFLGLRKGLSSMLAGLIEVIVAQVVVIEYSAAFASFLSARFQIPAPVLAVAIFAALAIVSILIVRFTFKLLSLIASLEFKQPLKNLGGALAGGILFVLFFALISNFLTLFPVPYIQESFQHKSLSGPYLIQMCEQIHYIFERWIPASLQI